MSKDKEIINKLFKVVSQQQQIITKIAQTLGGEVKEKPLPAPQTVTRREADTILSSLPPNVRGTVDQLVVVTGSDPDTSVVKVRFMPNKRSQMAFNAIKNTITGLQNQNVLPSLSYDVIEVA